MSFWRLDEDARLKHVWRPVARMLGALTLKYSKKATRAIIITADTRYEYSLSISENIPRRFKDIDIEEVCRIATYPGRPTLVTISISPGFLEAGEKITLKNPPVLVKGYPLLVCVSAVSGGTVGLVRQACLTPLRLMDLRLG